MVDMIKVKVDGNDCVGGCCFPSLCGKIVKRHLPPLGSVSNTMNDTVDRN